MKTLLVTKKRANNAIIIMEPRSSMHGRPLLAYVSVVQHLNLLCIERLSFALC